VGDEDIRGQVSTTDSGPATFHQPASELMFRWFGL